MPVSPKLAKLVCVATVDMTREQVLVATNIGLFQFYRRRIVMRLTCLFVIMLLSASLAGVAAQNAAEDSREKPSGVATDAAVVGSIPVFNPAETTIAVLPVVNETGKQNEELQKICFDACEMIGQIFADRGFRVTPSADLAAFLAQQKINPGDEENRTKSQLLSIGKGLQANLVIAAVLKDLDTQMKVGVWVSRKVGRAKMQVKMLDVGSEGYLINGIFEANKRGQAIFPDTAKSKSLRSQAVMNAVSAAFQDFLKPYKPLPKSPEEKAAEKSSTPDK